MSLKMFFDQACTQPVLTAEKFIGDGSLTTCTLSAFTGAQLGGVYKEVKVPYAAITFANGIGSGFSGLPVGLLKGQRVIHGNKYVGQIADNTATTITISDLTYSGTSLACYISSYTKLYTPLHFTIADNDITLVDAAAVGEVIHAIPVATLAMYFGGSAAGTNVTKETFIFIQRDAGYEYTLLQVSSDDTSLFPYHTSTPAVVFADGVGTGFSGLPAGALVGKALNHTGKFKGIITANTESTVTISDSSYTGVAAIAEIFNVGTLQFSLDGIAWAPVVEPNDLTAASSAVKVFIKDTIQIPVAAINYPSNIVKVSGVEYIA